MFASRRVHLCPAGATAQHRMTPRQVKARSGVEFSKYQGLGNNFILVDNRGQSDLLIDAEASKKWCDVCFGVGGDGVIFATDGNGSGLGMRIFNSDGSEPEMCGNGIRCLAKFVADIDGTGAQPMTFDTLAGEIVAELLEDGRVKVDMGMPQLAGTDVPTTLEPTEGSQVVAQTLEVAGSSWTVTAVGMGNPHAVVYSRDGQPLVVRLLSASSPAAHGSVPFLRTSLPSLADPCDSYYVSHNMDTVQSTPHWLYWAHATEGRCWVQVDDVDLEVVGPSFENHPVFPQRTNTEFVEVVSRSHVKMSVWERGAGRTLACGTGACALVVAGVLEGHIDRSCRVDLPGGPLEIEWRESDGRIFMTGPAERVFVGKADI